MDNLEIIKSDALCGSPTAQYELALHFERNDNYNEAVFWLKKAAQQGFDVAQNHIAIYYEKGLGVSQDYADAAHYFMLAAEQGFKPAMCSIADYYEKGLGVPKNNSLAIFWREKYNRE